MTCVKVQAFTKDKRGKRLLNGVNLEMRDGYCYELRGVNGSGKTMLLRAIAGLLKPTSGFVSVDGEVLGRDIEFPRSIGAMIEGPAFLPNRTGFDNLALIASIRGVADDAMIRSSMKSVGLDPADRRKYKSYSLGMKQRLGIACAVMESPKIVLLDEPLNALDDCGAEIVCGLVRGCKESGALVVVANHAQGLLDGVVDATFHMVDGRIVPA